MDTLDAIKTRRSVRKYKTTPVETDILNQVLEAARSSPSWANTQCVRYIIIRSKETKAKLAEILSRNNPATNAIQTAPVVIVVCAELEKSGYYKGTASTVKGNGWYMFDAGIAMENLSLAAHAFGLGTVNVGFMDSQKAEQILDVPDGYTVIEVTPLGYPDGDSKPTPRKELSEIVFKEKFGIKYE